MMTREDRQEALSLAYIKAVAAIAGMTYSVRSNDYGIDITLHEIQSIKRRFRETGYNLDIQVKSTTSIVETRTSINYDLPKKAYEDLRLTVNRPRILAICVLPNDERKWLRQTPTKLEMRKCVYWISLQGCPAIRNRASIRIVIPKKQIFTPDSLHWIMDRIRAEESLS